jgi:hypothetical protein
MYKKSIITSGLKTTNKFFYDKENEHFSFSNKEEFQPSLPGELFKYKVSQLCFLVNFSTLNLKQSNLSL